jgi:hypothetical protein
MDRLTKLDADLVASELHLKNMNKTWKQAA